MPFKLMGKSPLMKKLVGNQHRLPEKLKQFIKDAPGKLMKKPSPNKQSVRADTRKKELDKRNDPNKEKSAFDKYLERNRQAAVERDLRQGFDTEATRALKRSQGQLKSGTEGAGSATANQNAGQTMQQAFNKVKNMSQSKKDSVKKMKSQLTGDKKAEVKKTEVTPQVKTEVTTPKPPKVGPTLSGTSSVMGDKKGGTKGFSTVKVGGSGGAKATFGKKVINRQLGFTDELGTTFTRDVKGRKKADGSVSKTITKRRQEAGAGSAKVTSQKDVTKGPKVKGQRKAKTVTKTKFDKSGNVRKVVTRTRGKGRKVLSDTEAKDKVEELKKRREEREKSPTKLMKNKTPNKMMKKSPTKKMHKGGMKMMKKKSPTMMMKKSPSKKMMKAPMKKMMKKKK